MGEKKKKSRNTLNSFHAFYVNRNIRVGKEGEGRAAGGLVVLE